MDIINICILILNYYVCIYIAYKLNKWTIKIGLNTSLTIAALSIIFNYIIKIPFFNTIKIVFSTINLYLILKISFRKNIFTTLKTFFFIILIMFISEMLVTAVSINILYIDFAKLYNDNIVHIVSNIVVYVTSILISGLAIKIIKYTNLNYYNIKYRNNLFNIFFMISIISMLILNYFMLYENLSTKVFYITFAISMFHAFIVLVFMQKNFMIIKKEDDYERLKLYTNIIEGLVDDASKFKHDFNSIMFMIKGYLDDDNFEGLKEHFADKMLQENNFSDILKLKKIKNAGLKGLLAYKIASIESSKVKIHIEILNDIDKLNIDIVDLCRILGILIDNAYEAARISKEKFMTITFIQDETLNITILNSCNNDINVPNIYKLGYSTKSSNSGVGLYNVKDIIDKKYDNVLLETNFDKDVFIQDLYIKAK